jgi:hypothetical protein
MPSICCQ